MDPSREQWNDRALDRLAKDVDDLSEEFNIVRRIPTGVAKALDAARDRTDEQFREAERNEVRRISELRAYVDKRIDERPAAPKVPWTTIIAFAGTIIVPVVIAVLGWWFISQGAA
jgi:hypothetical protein